MPWTTETKGKSMTSRLSFKRKKKEHPKMVGFELLEDDGMHQAVIIKEGHRFPKTGYFTYRDGRSVAELSKLGIKGILKMYVSDNPEEWPEYVKRQCKGTANEDYIGVTSEIIFERKNKWGEIYP